MAILDFRHDRIGLAGFLITIILIGRPEVGSAQSVFDPYRPEQAAYNAYTQPTQPTNLALPNAARESADYGSPNGVSGSRYNQLDGYLNNETDRFGFRRSSSNPATGNATSGSDGGRRPDPYDRSYVPNREIDKRFYESQARKEEDSVTRDRLYRQLGRESDPSKRAQLKRDLARLNSEPRSSSAPRPGDTRRASPASTNPETPATSSRTPRPSAVTDRPTRNSPATSARPAAPSTLGGRPLSPSELQEQLRRDRRARTAPAVPSSATPAGETSPRPDSAALPR